LIANFVASLVTTPLPLAAILNSLGAILRQIFPGSTGPTGVRPRATGCRTSSHTGGSSRRDFWCAALQEISRGAAPSRGSGCRRCTGRGPRNVEEAI